MSVFENGGLTPPPIDVSFHSEKDDETVDEIGPYCQTNPRCNHMGQHDMG